LFYPVIKRGKMLLLTPVIKRMWVTSGGNAPTNAAKKTGVPDL
jgi:hypothetical protein